MSRFFSPFFWFWMEWIWSNPTSKSLCVVCLVRMFLTWFFSTGVISFRVFVFNLNWRVGSCACLHCSLFHLGAVFRGVLLIQGCGWAGAPFYTCGSWPGGSIWIWWAIEAVWGGIISNYQKSWLLPIAVQSSDSAALEVRYISSSPTLVLAYVESERF